MLCLFMVNVRLSFCDECYEGIHSKIVILKMLHRCQKCYASYGENVSICKCNAIDCIIIILHHLPNVMCFYADQSQWGVRYSPDKVGSP